VIFNPLAGGLFTGKYKNGVMPNDGRFGVENTHQGKWYRDRYFKPSLFEALDIVSPVAEKHGLTMVEVALRWCTHHSALNIGSNGRDGIIIGFSSYTQLERNLDDFEKGPLPREVVDALDEAWRVSKGEAVAYWHGTLEYQYDTKKSLFNSSG
jgi:aflatoxin B1 aldehyde reductase